MERFLLLLMISTVVTVSQVAGQVVTDRVYYQDPQPDTLHVPSKKAVTACRDLGDTYIPLDVRNQPDGNVVATVLAKMVRRYRQLRVNPLPQGHVIHVIYLRRLPTVAEMQAAKEHSPDSLLRFCQAVTDCFGYIPRDKLPSQFHGTARVGPQLYLPLSHLNQVAVHRVEPLMRPNGIGGQELALTLVVAQNPAGAVAGAVAATGLTAIYLYAGAQQYLGKVLENHATRYAAQHIAELTTGYLMMEVERRYWEDGELADRVCDFFDPIAELWRLEDPERPRGPQPPNNRDELKALVTALFTGAVGPTLGSEENRAEILRRMEYVAQRLDESRARLKALIKKIVDRAKKRRREKQNQCECELSRGVTVTITPLTEQFECEEICDHLKAARLHQYDAAWRLGAGKSGVVVADPSSDAENLPMVSVVKILKDPRKTYTDGVETEARRQGFAQIEGFHVPEVFAYAKGSGDRDYLVMERIRGMTFYDFFWYSKDAWKSQHGLEIHQVLACAQQCQQDLVRLANDHGLYLIDAHAGNVMVQLAPDQEVGRMYFIDFGGAVSGEKYLRHKHVIKGFWQDLQRDWQLVVDGLSARNTGRMVPLYLLMPAQEQENLMDSLVAALDRSQITRLLQANKDGQDFLLPLGQNPETNGWMALTNRPPKELGCRVDRVAVGEKNGRTWYLCCVFDPTKTHPFLEVARILQILEPR